jgi:hypothetical protein
VCQRAADQPAQPGAVARQIVAAHQRDWPGAGPRAGQQAAYQHAGHRRRRPVGGQVRFQRIVGAQPAGRRVQLVRLLGHGQRHDADRGVGEQRHDRERITRRVPDAGQRADHARAGLPRGQAGDAEQQVLGLEVVEDVQAARRHADDPPVATRRRDRLLGVHRLVGAVERAESQVDDPCPDLTRAHQRPALDRKPSYGAQAEPPHSRRHVHRHTGPSGNRYSSMESGRIVAL